MVLDLRKYKCVLEKKGKFRISTNSPSKTTHWISFKTCRGFPDTLKKQRSVFDATWAITVPLRVKRQNKRRKLTQ